MKTRINIVLLIFVISLSSCFDDFHGNGGGDDIVFTETNYVYEGDLYQRYLTTQILQEEATIIALKEIIDNKQADQETFDKLKEAEEKYAYFVGEYEEADKAVGKLKNPRPQPCPEEDIIKDLCIPDWEKIMWDKEIDLQIFKVLNENGELIHDLVDYEPMDVPDFEEELTVQCNSALNNITGKVSFSARRLDRFGNYVSYSL